MVRSIRSHSRASQPSSFSESEIKQMQELLQEKKDGLFDQRLYQKLTEEFNLAPGRAGSGDIQMEKVKKWFENKLNTRSAEIVSSPDASPDNLSDAGLTPDAPKNLHLSKDAKKRASEATEFEFEAKSYRDYAWYDVAMFLAHRYDSSDEVEVRVRFDGFGAEEDEWVNVKNAVRERSIPLEPSECSKVAVGDLVLCFQESNEQAMYFDAHVLDIERKQHDIRGCWCVFLVQYDHDQAEVTGSLKHTNFPLVIFFGPVLHLQSQNHDKWSLLYIQEKVRLPRLCRRP